MPLNTGSTVFRNKNDKFTRLVNGDRGKSELKPCNFLTICPLLLLITNKHNGSSLIEFSKHESNLRPSDLYTSSDVPMLCYMRLQVGAKYDMTGVKTKTF